MVAKVVKSRKLHVSIKVDEDGNFICPVQKQRQIMTAEMCFGRQLRRYRGCVRCRIPNKIERKKVK